MKKLLLSIFTLTSGYFYSQVHFQENFDNGLPGTWATFIGTNGAGTTENWGTVNPGFSSDSAMFVDYEDNGGTVSEDWLVTPQITLGASMNQLNFYMAQDLSSDYGSVYEIKVSTTSQTNHASFTTVQTWSETDFASQAWVFQSVDLSAYNGQSVYIAFVFSQDDGDSWYVDSVVVETPTCFVPTSIMASNIANDSADISWTGVGSNYQIQYSPSIGGNVMDSVFSGTSFTITGLPSNSLVSYRLREICGAGDSSAWSSVYTFTTTCTPMVSLPYSQNFDTDTNAYLPCGWVRENLNSDNQQWGITDFVTPKSGSYLLGIGYNGTLAMNDWVITPEFALVGGQEYQLKVSYATSTSYPEDFAFYYGNGQASSGLTNLITSYTTVTTADAWIDTIMRFTPSTSGNYAIGIHGTSLADQDYIGIEDFELSIYTPPASINELANNLEVSVFPNPNNGDFSVKNSSNENVSAIITDIQGKVVKTINNINANSTTKIDLNNVKSGFYYVILNGEHASKRIKVSIN